MSFHIQFLVRNLHKTFTYYIDVIILSFYICRNLRIVEFLFTDPEFSNVSVKFLNMFYSNNQ